MIKSNTVRIILFIFDIVAYLVTIAVSVRRKAAKTVGLYLDCFILKTKTVKRTDRLLCAVARLVVDESVAKTLSYKHVITLHNIILSKRSQLSLKLARDWAHIACNCCKHVCCKHVCCKHVFCKHVCCKHVCCKHVCCKHGCCKHVC